ncbi:Uncharacterised protein [Bacteroides eggerthii]|uniref:Uncharacterized protein n=1 Tax=Bacteroides eggerthii TaxID=28111 RepID=A0A380ZAT6_9BACE|nr:Uncharacterised protein [Bacteroides eggerthii]
MLYKEPNHLLPLGVTMYNKNPPHPTAIRPNNTTNSIITPFLNNTKPSIADKTTEIPGFFIQCLS